MGFLPNASAVVDMVLTKRGRRKIAEGRELNIEYFGLTDAGIDYRIWNPDHPDGTDYYGNAIENMPLTEASTHADIADRYRLLTLDRNTVALPVISEITDIVFDDLIYSKQTITPQIMNYSGAGTDSFVLIVGNASLLNVAGASHVDINEIVAEFPEAGGFRPAAAYRGKSFTLSPIQGLTKDYTVTCNIVHDATGATTSFTVNMKENIKVGTVPVKRNPRK